ncbi:hypothetical protein F5B22DRAFT_660627 [Xylaria bambusicola]|uniref:uncharacterized protein n=1 Tax=Xylaria bambusicola TaxID=326684 RepID=UPI002007F88A|nr:uncharacterized protein F5B22DRAFT_660627 [Xylaria bambusicola]KAI0522309.1 hypothetical protein F5B22DRAFT_660627 [Xylaria bambusicola]
MSSLLRVVIIAARYLLWGDLLVLLSWSMEGAVKIDKNLNDDLNRLEGSSGDPNASLTETIILKTTAEYAIPKITLHAPEISFPEMDPYQISETLSEVLTTSTTPSAESSSITTITDAETAPITIVTVAETPAITTATTADTVVITDTKSQSQETGLDTQSDLLGCNFPELYLGSFRLHPPPFDISNRIGLYHWESAARQLQEIRRLIKANGETLVRKYGSIHVDYLNKELDNFVDKPLRFGCRVLPYLQAKLLELSTNTTGLNAAKRERRIALANLLDDVEKKIRQSPWESWTLTVLPAWAREAPELRSKACPKQDCFRVNGATLESVTQDIPEKLLFAVLDIKDHAQWTVVNIGKALYRRMKEILVEVDSAFITFYESRQLNTALLIALLLVNVSLFLFNFWPQTYRSVMAARRPEPGLFNIGGPAEGIEFMAGPRAAGGPQAVGGGPPGNEAADGPQAAGGDPPGDE